MPANSVVAETNLSVGLLRCTVFSICVHGFYLLVLIYDLFIVAADPSSSHPTCIFVALLAKNVR